LKAESQEPPPEVAEMMREMGELSIGETEYFDLRRVAMFSPAGAAHASMAGGAG